MTADKQTVVVVPLTVEGHGSQSARGNHGRQTRTEEEGDLGDTCGNFSDSECGHKDRKGRKCKGKDKHHGHKKDKKDKKYKKFLKHKFEHVPDYFPQRPDGPPPGDDMFRFIRPPFRGHMSRGRGHWPHFHPRGHCAAAAHSWHGPWGFRETVSAQSPFTVDLQHFKAEEISVTVEDGFLVVNAKHEPREQETGHPMRDVTVRYDVTDRTTEGVRGTLREDGVLELFLPEVQCETEEAEVLSSSTSDDELDGTKMDEES